MRRHLVLLAVFFHGVSTVGLDHHDSNQRRAGTGEAVKHCSNERAIP